MTKKRKSRRSSDDEQHVLDDIEKIAQEPTSHNSVLDRTVTFAQLGLHEQLCETCEKLGYKHPTKIQVETLRVALDKPTVKHGEEEDEESGREQSRSGKRRETGSGKTAAFVLPVLHHLLTGPVRPSPGSALIMTPTRELAQQIKEHFDALGAEIGLRTALLVGGVEMFRQQLQIEQQKPHVIIGTPGRVCKHLRDTPSFKLYNLKFLVLDEADKMLGIEFEDELMQVLEHSDKTKRTTYLFSATMTKKVEKLQKAQMRDPILVRVAPSRYATVDTLTQQYMFVPEKFKEVYLSYLLNEHAGKRIMIFTGQNATCITLTLMLRALNFPVVPLAGHMKESDRMHCLSKFKSGSRPILIATDVASRGLDIPHVEMVVVYDIPVHSKEYIHRVGRTARAGKQGRAVTFVSQYDLEYFQKIERLIGKKMDEYKTVKDDVMVLVNTVSEALKMAKDKVKQSDTMHIDPQGEDDEEVIYDAVMSLTKKREAKRSKGKRRNQQDGGGVSKSHKMAITADKRRKQRRRP